ncbi:unnamed protein product [Caenorhabditis angaria]|uniref:Nipped-B protein n=1 Tax=Caenorhabditis angaria TaxID=860376 RepID=A0A9P1MZY6_9PELO|nr:unnamed protein product [Caenorhabditis angaria]
MISILLSVQSINTLIKCFLQIVFGAGSETVVNLRTRALKCLTMIIEADHEVLIMDEVQKAVHSRMMDSHAQVREASIELLGKFLLVKEEFIIQYYPMLVERILDSGIAVRKRVIRIMREICEKFPRYENIPEMLSKMIRRVNDEEGVKKLVHETFSTLWFQPIDERTSNDAISTKVMVMSRVVQHCIADSTVEYLETLVHTILKSSDKGVLFASKQIIDNLVDCILHLETKMANESSQMDQQNMNELEKAAKSKQNQDRLLACLTTMAIFSKVRPELMVKHAETLQPYLTTTSTKVRTASEVAVMNEVVGMLERVVPLMSHPSDQFLSGIDDDLTKMATQFGMQIVVSSVSCAAAVYNRFRKQKPRLADRFLNFYNCLKRGKASYEQNPQLRMDEKNMAILQRALFTIGVLCRYFDFDEIIGSSENDAKITEESDKPKRQIRDSVFNVLEFFSKSNNPSIKQKALTSLGHFCAQYSEYLTRPDLQHMYSAILSSKNPNAHQLKIQILKNLEMFLQTEEKKLIKCNEDWEVTKDRENLKEMELSGSGLGSTVIQLYWNSVLNSYFDQDVNIRVSAVQVTWLTLSQGLVTPGSSIATLIAMTTDPLDIIRNRIDNLLKEIDSKYAGMVQSKAILGVRVAYKLHQKIRMAAIQEHPEISGIVRGVRFCDFSATSTSSSSASRGPFAIPRMSNDGMALLSGLYQSLRTNRQQRRSFLQAILKLFADDSREKLKLEEWIFVADNVAMFPYQMMDEPLYVIRLIDQIVAQSGQSIIMQFKQNLQPLRPHEQHLYDDEDLMFDPENLFSRFPPNKDNLYDLMVNSQSCFILLYIRNFLIKLYGFSDAKVQEYLPSEAAKVYEKAASRKNIHMFTPMTALEELNPQTIAERNTMKGDYDLAQKISRFRKMLLSLDRGDDNEDEDSKAIVPNQGDDYDDEDDYQGGEEEEETGSISSAAPNEE